MFEASVLFTQIIGIYNELWTLWLGETVKSKMDKPCCLRNYRLYFLFIVCIFLFKLSSVFFSIIYNIIDDGKFWNFCPTKIVKNCFKDTFRQWHKKLTLLSESYMQSKERILHANQLITHLVTIMQVLFYNR